MGLLVCYGQQEKTGRVYVRTKVRSTAFVNVPLLRAKYWILLSPHSPKEFLILCVLVPLCETKKGQVFLDYIYLKLCCFLFLASSLGISLAINKAGSTGTLFK